MQSGQQNVVLDGQPLSVTAATLRDRTAGLTSEGQRLRVWRFYWVGNRFTASDVQAKLAGAWGLLQGQGDDAAIVVLSTPLDGRLPNDNRVAAADQLLASFLQAQAGALQAALRTTRQGN